jgi:dienelactone hydrolase
MTATTSAATTATIAPARDLEVELRTVGDLRIWQPAGEGGPWPLVVFAHGYNTTAKTYDRLLRSWAAAGYVVAGTASNEPDAISAAIDDLTDDPDVDVSRVAVAGHSDGATRSVLVGYAPQDRDARVKAVIALVSSPLDGLGPLRGPPLLLEQGDADSTSDKSQGDALYQQVATTKWYLVLHGAEHAPPVIDDTPWTPIVDDTALAFLDRYVAGRTQTDAAIRAAAGEDPDLASFFVG